MKKKIRQIRLCNKSEIGTTGQAVVLAVCCSSGIVAVTTLISLSPSNQQKDGENYPHEPDSLVPSVLAHIVVAVALVESAWLYEEKAFRREWSLWSEEFLVYIPCLVL